MHSWDLVVFGESAGTSWRTWEFVYCRPMNVDQAFRASERRMCPLLMQWKQPNETHKSCRSSFCTDHLGTLSAIQCHNYKRSPLKKITSLFIVNGRGHHHFETAGEKMFGNNLSGKERGMIGFLYDSNSNWEYDCDLWDQYAFSICGMHDFWWDCFIRYERWFGMAEVMRSSRINIGFFKFLLRDWSNMAAEPGFWHPHLRVWIGLTNCLINFSTEECCVRSNWTLNWFTRVNIVAPRCLTLMVGKSFLFV